MNNPSISVIEEAEAWLATANRVVLTPDTFAYAAREHARALLAALRDATEALEEIGAVWHNADQNSSPYKAGKQMDDLARTALARIKGATAPSPGRTEDGE